MKQLNYIIGLPLVVEVVLEVVLAWLLFPQLLLLFFPRLFGLFFPRPKLVVKDRELGLGIMERNSSRDC